MQFSSSEEAIFGKVCFNYFCRDMIKAATLSRAVSILLYSLVWKCHSGEIPLTSAASFPAAAVAAGVPAFSRN